MKSYTLFLLCLLGFVGSQSLARADDDTRPWKIHNKADYTDPKTKKLVPLANAKVTVTIIRTNAYPPQSITKTGMTDANGIANFTFDVPNDGRTWSIPRQYAEKCGLQIAGQCTPKLGCQMEGTEAFDEAWENYHFPSTCH